MRRRRRQCVGQLLFIILLQNIEDTTEKILEMNPRGESKIMKGERGGWGQ